MNEQQTFERTVAESVSSVGPLVPTDDAIERTLARTGRKRQRPRWLALIKEPPMHSDSRTTVGSPTVRVAAVLAATLMLILAMTVVGAGVQRLLAADADIVVAQDGTGDHRTIQRAVRAATKGDRILVRPGVYREQVQIKKTIELVGDGGPGDVVIELVNDGAIGQGVEDVYALRLIDSGSAVSNLTVRAAGFDHRNEDIASATPVSVEGGAPTLDALLVEGGTVFGMVLADTKAEVTDVELHGPLEVYSGAPRVKRSRLLCGVGLEGDAVLRNNTIRGDGDCLVDQEWGIPLAKDVGITEGASPTLRGNDISMDGGGIVISSEAGSPTLDANRIHGNDVAVSIAQGPTPAIIDNEFMDNDSAIVLVGGPGQGPNAVITGNSISGGENGILINGGRSSVTGNTIEGASRRGIFISGAAAPTLRDNSLCGNGTDLEVLDSASPDIDESNEIC